MFRKLRNKIIIITMAITTTVLILAGVVIMLFSSTMRPEPMPFFEPSISQTDTSRSVPKQPENINDQELKEYINKDRKEGNIRLLITLLCVGALVELLVFLIVYYSSKKIVEPVKDSYEKQKFFIANASHELKTPLAIIQANLEALDVDKESEKWKTNIENETAHANKLVLDLLQLAKMDAKEAAKSAPEDIDLKTEINGRIDTFQPKFSGKISLKTSEYKKTYFLPKQDILQLLDILLDNATKYGEKKIIVSLEENRIIVANDGTIISKENAKKIFDRFYQIDKTKEGSGLGLSIAQAICQQNNWQISCESTKTFTKFIIGF